MCRFLSPNLFLKNMKYQLRKQLSSFENERPILFSYTILFMISKKAYHRCMFFSPSCIHAPKISRRHANSFWTLKLPLCGLELYKLSYKHVFTHRMRQEFQNILEKKLRNCFRQLLFIYLKMFNMELEIYSRFDEYLAIYQQMMNLTVVYFVA